MKKKTKKPSKVETPYCNGTWSESKYKSFVRSGMRMLWTKWPVKFMVLLEARRAYKGPNKQQKWEYRCASCKQWCMQKNIQVDHIEDIGTITSKCTFYEVVSRFLSEPDNLQVLCKPCHKTKTAEERKKSKEEL